MGRLIEDVASAYIARVYNGHLERGSGTVPLGTGEDQERIGLLKLETFLARRHQRRGKFLYSEYFWARLRYCRRQATQVEVDYTLMH